MFQRRKEEFPIKHSSPFLIESKEYITSFRGDNISALDEFLRDWKLDRIKILQTLVKQNRKFFEEHRSIHKLICQEVTAEENSPTLSSRIGDLDNVAEDIEKVDSLLSLWMSSFLSRECHRICHEFLLSMQIRKYFWECGDSHVGDHVWRTLRSLHLTTGLACNNALVSAHPICANSTNLKYVVMPVVLKTAIEKFESIISTGSIKDQVVSMQSLMEQISSCRPVITAQKSQLSNPMVYLRILVHTKLINQIDNQFDGRIHTGVSSTPRKKRRTLHEDVTIPTPTENDILYSGNIVPQPGDGHCLFHSIFYARTKKASTVDEALGLRRQLSLYMADHAKEKAGDVELTLEEAILSDTDIMRHALDETGKPCFNTYLNNLCQGSKIYGGAVEISCLSQMLNTSIIVFQKVQRDGKVYFAANELRTHTIRNAENEIGILFQNPPAHYDVLENYFPLETGN